MPDGLGAMTHPSARSGVEVGDASEVGAAEPGEASPSEAAPPTLDPLEARVAESQVIKNHAAFIWSVADLLRGDYKQSEYGKVILPLVVLRRLDCVLEPTKEAVLARYEALKGSGIENVEPVL